MSDFQKPAVLTLLSSLAIVIGVFSVIDGALRIYSGIDRIINDFTLSGILYLVFGIICLAVGGIALVAGIRTIFDKKRAVSLLQIFAMALIGFDVLWFIFTRVTDEKISWLLLVAQLAIGIAALVIIKTNDDIKGYLGSQE
jgi:hypothetical protein